MPNHNAVTTSIAGASGTVTVHFHCPCGVNRQETVVTGPDEIHPIRRYTAAIRSLHQRGQWPPPAAELGDAADAGWGAATPELAE